MSSTRRRSASAIAMHVLRGVCRMSTEPADDRPDARASPCTCRVHGAAHLLGRREHGDGVGLAVGDEVRALERVDGDVDRRLVRSPPIPTRSPMYSIGASSRSPSPMTIVPANSISSMVARIASVAARSAPSDRRDPSSGPRRWRPPRSPGPSQARAAAPWLLGCSAESARRGEQRASAPKVRERGRERQRGSRPDQRAISAGSGGGR